MDVGRVSARDAHDERADSRRTRSGCRRSTGGRAGRAGRSGERATPSDPEGVRAVSSVSTAYQSTEEEDTAVICPLRLSELVCRLYDAVVLGDLALQSGDLGRSRVNVALHEVVAEDTGGRHRERAGRSPSRRQGSTGASAFAGSSAPSPRGNQVEFLHRRVRLR